MKKISCVWQTKEVPKFLKDVQVHKQWKSQYAIQPLDQVPMLHDNPLAFAIVSWGIEKNSSVFNHISFKKVYSSTTTRLPFRSQRAIYLFDSFYDWDKSKVPVRIQPVNKGIQYGLAIQMNNTMIPIIDLQDNGLIRPLITSKEKVMTWLDRGKGVKELIQFMKKCSFCQEDWTSIQVTQKIFVNGYNDMHLHEYTPYHYNLFNDVA